jgi:predicted acetyltransferase
MTEKNDNFLMRQLDDNDLEEFNALLRYAFQVTSAEIKESGWTSEDEVKLEKIPILQKTHTIGWFYQGKLASQICVYPMKINFFGTTIAMGGITGVATYPEYTGRGLIHSLMKECLKYMKHEGQIVSFLYPYSIPFYRKMGWEIISDKMTFTIESGQLPKHEPVSGMIERMDRDCDDFKKIYKYFASQNHGALIRDELAWSEYWRWDNDDVTVAVYYTGEHQPTGSIVYNIENKVFYIKEMIYLNSEARDGLWNYISAHKSMVEEVKGANYTGEPLSFLLTDSRITETIRPYFMGRIVDLKPFMIQYPFRNVPDGMELYFCVTDPLAEWNTGTFLLSWKQKKTVFKKIPKKAAVSPLTMNIQTLMAMFMGYKRPSYLYENNRLAVEYWQVPILERIIPVDKPYFSDYF